MLDMADAAPANWERLPPAFWRALSFHGKDLLACLGLVLLTLAFFSPALLAGSSLAPGDATLLYLPNFYSSETGWWTEWIYSGYAAALDPQFQRYYLPFWLFPSYSSFVVFAYLVALIGTYLLALRVSGSRVGAFLAAITVGFSGFMVAHLAHTTIIHSACWIPWVLLAIERIRDRWSPAFVVVGAGAVSLLLAGGHPQIGISGLVLAAFFGARSVLNAEKSKWPMVLLQGLLIAILGFLLAAPVLAAYADIADEAVRLAWTEADFNSFSLTAAELPLFWFPNTFGADPASPFGAYSGPYNLTELAVYMGWLPWLVLPLILADRELFRKARFWLLVWAISTLATFGTGTFIGEMLYRLPVVGEFRAQARYGFIAVVAASMVLSLACSSDVWAVRRKRILLCGWFVVLLVAATTAALVASVDFRGLSDGEMMGRFLVPIVLLFGVGLAAIAYQRRKSTVTAAILSVAVLLDIWSFGWFYEWRGAPALSSFAISLQDEARLQDIRASGTRVLVPDGQHAGLSAVTPNVNLAHRVPLVLGYGPLADPSLLMMVRGNTTGYSAMPPPDAQLLDVLNVGWVVARGRSEHPPLLGSGCGGIDDIGSVEFAVPPGAASIRVVSHLSCSTAATNGTSFATLSLRPIEGEGVDAIPLRVGVDSSEWAIDRPDVQGVIAHSKSTIAESFDAGGFQGHWYSATIQVPQHLRGRALSASLRAVVPGMPFRISRIEASDATGTYAVVDLRIRSEEYARLTRPVVASGSVPKMFERKARLDWAWFSCDVRRMNPEEMQRVLWRPADAVVDVRDTILTEVDLQWEATGCGMERTHRILRRDPGDIELLIDAGGGAVLAVSERWHRGWRATFNGHAIPVFRAYGLIMGVVLPPGEGRLKLEFSPPLLKWAQLALFFGLALSGLITLIAAWLSFMKNKRKEK